MMRALCAKAIGDAKLLWAALLVAMLFFPWLYAWATSMVSLPAFSDFLANALPKQWQQVWGVPFSEVATPAGRVALVYVHPIIVFGAVVWAVARGSDCVSGEIGRGTMEMLLAQPVRRTSLYAAQALVTVLGSALLATGVWCGTALGLRAAPLYENLSPLLYIPPAVNLFGLMVCLGGLSAFVSAWDNQRWRTVGIVAAVYVLSMMIAVVTQLVDRWHWMRYLSLLNSYKPQTMVARHAEAWHLLKYHDGAVSGLGLGGHQFVLFVLGLVCYVAGAVVFSRREIPAPL
ncbi:MAG: ABC transporter permease [Pirellulales bacterium]